MLLINKATLLRGCFGFRREQAQLEVTLIAEERTAGAASVLGT